MILSDKTLVSRYREAEDIYNQDDIERAVELLLPLASEGVPEACQMLSFIHRVDEPFKDKVKEDHWNERYLFLLKKYAASGNLQAIFTLGTSYQYGNAIGINNKKAVLFITQAAEAGLAEAQFHLSTLYKYGWTGLRKNDEKEHYWLDKAAEQEHLEALYEKGLSLLDVKYCVKVHQFYIRIWCKNAPLKFLCSLLNSPTLAEQNLDAMHGNHIKNQKALSS